MIKVGIIGGDGYKAGEVLRLLINHPDVEILWVNSPEDSGALLSDIHQGLLGETYMRFTDRCDLESIDVLFMCNDRGQSAAFLNSHDVPDYLKIIDLSPDYRLKGDDAESANTFVYGLSELNRKPMVRGAKHVAVPGCFATAIELSLLPLAKNGLLSNTPIHVNAIIGSTGSGEQPTPTTHFSWRSENVSIFKPLAHPHLAEIYATLKEVQPDFDAEILFVPMLGCFTRGILAATYLDTDLPIDEIRAIYEEAYSDHNFTFVSDRRPDLKDVVNTNKCIIYLEKIGKRLVITTVLDNLLKGSAGSALHAMNLLFGLSERTGLTLKASAH